DFLDGILNQLGNASAHGQDIDERELNFMLSVIKGIEPRDQLEAMLAAQMAAVHVTTMTFARVASVNISAFNKLTRTFAMQIEAHTTATRGPQSKTTHYNTLQAPRAAGRCAATQQGRHARRGERRPRRRGRPPPRRSFPIRTSCQCQAWAKARSTTHLQCGAS